MKSLTLYILDNHFHNIHENPNAKVRLIPKWQDCWNCKSMINFHDSFGTCPKCGAEL